MDFTGLRYMVKVAEIGNVTQAANELYMTQPALSHYISRIEKEEGIKIFDRSTNPLSLTYAGELYISTAKKILELGVRLEDELDEITQNFRGRITIGLPPARAAHLLPLVMNHYLALYPNVQIQTVEHNSRQLKEDIRRGIVDFAILPELDGLEEFSKEKLFDEELLLVANDDMIDDSSYYQNEKGKRIIKFETLKSKKFVLLKTGHGIREAVNTLFNLHGFEPDILMETTNNETAFRMATSGLGLAIVPAMNTVTLKSLNSFHSYKLSDDGLKWTISAISQKNHLMNFLTQEFIRLTREICASYE